MFCDLQEENELPSKAKEEEKRASQRETSTHSLSTRSHLFCEIHEQPLYRDRRTEASPVAQSKPLAFRGEIVLSRPSRSFVLVIEGKERRSPQRKIKRLVKVTVARRSPLLPKHIVPRISQSPFSSLVSQPSVVHDFRSKSSSKIERIKREKTVFL